MPKKIVRKKKPSLPPDPDGLNRHRAAWATDAIHTFRSVTGADHEDALTDLIADLAHWADRNHMCMRRALAMAQMHYSAETNGQGRQL